MRRDVDRLRAATAQPHAAAPAVLPYAPAVGIWGIDNKACWKDNVSAGERASNRLRGARDPPQPCVNELE